MTDKHFNELVRPRNELRRCAAERDLNQFHIPRNLSASMCIESADLLERFQLSDRRSEELASDELTGFRHKIADVLHCFVRLSDKPDDDPISTAHGKIVINAAKYLVDKSCGSSRKYDQV